MNRSRSLPEEVWMEIIVRLPVKSIISLKCVSKFWYDFIQSPNFVSFHYHNPLNRPKLLVCHGIDPVQSSEDFIFRFNPMMKRFSLFPGELTDVGGSRDICDHLTEFEDKRGFIAVGPVEGLFMFHKCNTNEVGIWNPATAEFKQLPKPNLSIRFVCGGRNVFGFGINSLTNEYKLVCTPNDDYRLCETKTSSPLIKRHCSLWPRKGAAVCTIGGDGGCSWRDINGPELGSGWRIVGGCEIGSDATYSSGFYYWLSRIRCGKCKKFQKYKLVVFDMRTDVFTEMATPLYLNHDNNNKCTFSDVSSRVDNVVNLALHGDDDIALLVTQHSYQWFVDGWKYGPPVSAGVSIMKKEAEENWIKVYSHKLEPNICKELRLPLGIWKSNGIFFAKEDGRLLLYADASKEIVDLGVNKDYLWGHSFKVMVYNYKESLVSFGGQKKHPVFHDYFA